MFCFSPSHVCYGWSRFLSMPCAPTLFTMPRAPWNCDLCACGHSIIQSANPASHPLSGVANQYASWKDSREHTNLQQHMLARPLPKVTRMLGQWFARGVQLSLYHLLMDATTDGHPSTSWVKAHYAFNGITVCDAATQSRGPRQHGPMHTSYTIWYYIILMCIDCIVCHEI